MKKQIAILSLLYIFSMTARLTPAYDIFVSNPPPEVHAVSHAQSLQMDVDKTHMFDMRFFVKRAARHLKTETNILSFRGPIFFLDLDEEGVVCPIQLFFTPARHTNLSFRAPPTFI